jgi:hypothetical protein
MTQISLLNDLGIYEYLEAVGRGKIHSHRHMMVTSGLTLGKLPGSTPTHLQQFLGGL